MSHPALILALVAAAVVVNLPFGAYRVSVSRFSWRWFLAVHLPVPLLFLLRFEAHVAAWAIPLLVAGAVLGQYLGGRFSPLRRTCADTPVAGAAD
jgi:hypothetical protein